VTCLTEGNDRIPDTAGNNCKPVYNRIRDTVPPFLVTESLLIRSQQWYVGLRGNWWVGPRSESSSVSRRSQKCSALEVRRQCSTVPSVGSKELRVLSVTSSCRLDSEQCGRVFRSSPITVIRYLDTGK
jgi:hypothetical protein